MLRTIRHRYLYQECLELEAQHGQFAPCEAYAQPNDLDREHRKPNAGGVTGGILTALVDRLRMMRYRL